MIYGQEDIQRELDVDGMSSWCQRMVGLRLSAIRSIPFERSGALVFEFSDENGDQVCGVAVDKSEPSLVGLPGADPVDARRLVSYMEKSVVKVETRDLATVPRSETCPEFYGKGVAFVFSQDEWVVLAGRLIGVVPAMFG